MRVVTGLAVILLASLAACTPKGPNGPGGADDLDLGRTKTSHRTDDVATIAPAVGTPERGEAPPGPGVRAGTIDRAHLIAVLDKGPAEILHQIEVAPRLEGERFIGWQLVQLLEPTGTLAGVDVAPGDVLLAVNGKPISQPDQLFALWDSLRTANEVDAELWRGKNQLELRFVIEPKL